MVRDRRNYNETTNNYKNTPMQSGETPTNPLKTPTEGMNTPSQVSQTLKQQEDIAWLSKLSSLTGTELSAILTRIGVKKSRMSIGMGHAENWAYQNLNVRYAARAVPWSITKSMRAFVGQNVFDVAYKEVVERLADHQYRLTGREMRLLIKALGWTLTRTAKALSIDRATLNGMIARYYGTLLDIYIVDKLRKVIGEQDYELLRKKITDNHTTPSRPSIG